MALKIRNIPVLTGSTAESFIRAAEERERNPRHLRLKVSFDQIDETLAKGVPYCMFPEGRHRTERVLLPLQKGIARIAFRSARQRPTSVIPAGINYSDFFRYRGRCLLRFGKPLDVNAFLDSHSELTEAELHQAFREQLGERIQALVNPDEGSRFSTCWSPSVMGFSVNVQ